MSQDGEDLTSFRGVLTFDTSLDTIHVRAAAEEVTRALAGLRPGATAHGDVVGREIPLTNQGFLVVAFEGHDWCCAVSGDPQHPAALGADDAVALSRDLATRCIHLRIDDEDELVAYALLENGEAIEEYRCAGSGIDDEFEDSAEFEAVLRAELGLTGAEWDVWRQEHWSGATAEEYFEAHRAGVAFSSTRREVGAKSLDDPYSFADALFQEEGVADLGLRFEEAIERENWSPGESARVEPVQAPAYHRVDWISLPE